MTEYRSWVNVKDLKKGKHIFYRGHPELRGELKLYVFVKSNKYCHPVVITFQGSDDGEEWYKDKSYSFSEGSFNFLTKNIVFPLYRIEVQCLNDIELLKLVEVVR